MRRIFFTFDASNGNWLILREREKERILCIRGTKRVAEVDVDLYHVILCDNITIEINVVM